MFYYVFFNFLKCFFLFFFNVVFCCHCNKNVQNYKYDAFLI